MTLNLWRSINLGEVMMRNRRTNMYNYEKEVYCCDNCGKEIYIYCGWMNGLCSECWIEEMKESEGEHEEQ